MNEVVAMKEKRAADVADALDTKLHDIDALLDIMCGCDKDESDVNAAAYAIQRMVGDAIDLGRELYHAPAGGAL